MIKINKHLLLFAGIFFFLGIIVMKISQKFSPLFTHTVYYCQAFVSSLSIKLPTTLSLLFPVLGIFVLAIFIIRLVITYLAIRKLKNGLMIREKYSKKFNLIKKQLGLADKAYLVVNDKPFGFCFGIGSPKIYVSTALVKLIDRKELKAVMYHEKYHLENRDTATMFFAQIVQSLFPFFPILSDLIQNFQIEREIKADTAAVCKLGESEPLCSALKKLLSYDSAARFAFVPAIGEAKTLEVRVNTLMSKSASYRKFRPLNIFISLLSIVLLSFLILIPVNAMDLHNHGQKDNVMMVCLQGGQCSNWCKENRSVTPYSGTLQSSPLDK